MPARWFTRNAVIGELAGETLSFGALIAELTKRNRVYWRSWKDSGHNDLSWWSVEIQSYSVGLDIRLEI